MKKARPNVFKGFPSFGIVRDFETSIDLLVFRAKYLSTGARRADLSQFIKLTLITHGKFT